MVVGIFWAVGGLLLKAVWIGGVGRSRTEMTPGLGRLSRCWGIGGEGYFSLSYHLAGAVYGWACPSLGVYVEGTPGRLELGIA